MSTKAEIKKEEEANILQLYSQGLGLIRIAKRYKSSAYTIKKILETGGVVIRQANSRGRPKQSNGMMTKGWDKGMSAGFLSKKL
jgi:DNA invertase Pin-like site-specific DNA recombinase